MSIKHLAFIPALAFAVAAIARPAPWFLWASRLDGKTTCAQISPGAGWKQVDGPFKDVRCASRA